MNFKSALSLLLSYSLAASATATPRGTAFERGQYAPIVTAMNDVARTRLAAGLKSGFDVDDAYLLLKAHYRGAADQAYLDESRAAIPKTERTLRPKRATAATTGYDLELDSGARVAVHYDPRTRLARVNGRSIDVHRLSARGTFEAVAAGLGARTAGRLWRELDPWPRAEALVGALAALTLVVLVLTYAASNADRAKPTKKVAAEELPSVIDEANVICEQEIAARKTAGQSYTASITRALENAKLLQINLRDVPCSEYSRQVAVAWNTDKSGPPASKEAIEILCSKAKTYLLCARRFQEQPKDVFNVFDASGTGR